MPDNYLRLRKRSLSLPSRAFHCVELTPARVFLIMSLLLSSLCHSTHAQFSYTNENGSIKITKYIGFGANVVIPDQISGLPVTVIGPYAFTRSVDLNKITTVVIPDRVIEIQEYAFASLPLTNVTFGRGLKSIGQGAFANCRLPHVTIPTTITNLAPYIFCACRSLSQITVPDNIVSVGDRAFSDCTSLTNIFLGKAVSHLGDQLFLGCTNLSAIKVDSLNSSFSDSDGILFNKSKSDLIFYPVAKSGATYTLPDSVTNIALEVFKDARLSDLIASAQNPAFATIDGVLFNKNLTELIRFPLKHRHYDYVVPESVTNISDGAFFGSLVMALSAPSVQTIGDHAFASCPYFYGASFRDLVEIKTNAFQQCTVLKSVALGQNLRSIRPRAFWACGSLPEVELPFGLDEIADSAFAVCESLRSIIVPDSVRRIGTNAFYCCYSLTNASIGNHVLEIGDTAFFACHKLSTITLSDGLQKIGSQAFTECSSLSEINIPPGVASIADATFRDCESLRQVTLPGITSIGESSFRNCSNLFRVSVGNSLTNRL